ncbi:MAG: YmdB family metallophosphoesterase [Candidatus Spechtbacteria bacterium]|nr:YmdB family metallophosphoesterase [Candidatus Spechtbacteria bacterium]
MKILFFGDVFGRPGRDAVAEVLPRLRKKYSPDVVGANVENLAHGHGISRESLGEMENIGVDFFTSGNHVWEGKDSKALLEKRDLPLVRPANYPPGVLGKGFSKVRVGTKTLLVVNLMGRVFMKMNLDCPLRGADEILSRYSLKGERANESEDEEDKECVDAIFLDFHAEATSEKRVLGFYLDGRVSCVVGTHTHVPTADEQILPKGTGYISDVGMCGVRDSSIGMDKDIMIKEMLTQVPEKKEVAEGTCEIGAILFDIGKDGLSRKVKRIREMVE